MSTRRDNLSTAAGYEVLELLKESSKGTVSLLYDAQDRRMLVEKRLNGELSVYRRLLELPHPCLPRLYEVRFENGQTVVLEEYIPGGSVAVVKASEKQLTAWLMELCRVLEFLHRHHILHRDIKPSNLLLGGDGHIRLTDFDAAREDGRKADQDTQLLGTRGYAPPEQYGFAQTDERSDIYALGVTFRELLGPLTQKRRWKHILNRCTALEPRHRYRHVWQIRWAVLLGKLRRWVFWPLLGVLAAVLLAIATFFLWSYQTNTDFQDAVNIVLSSRRALVFDRVDIEALKKSGAVLDGYTGDTVEAYRILAAMNPDLTLISTGYADEEGRLLFGGFTTVYEIDTGRTYYQQFVGLYTVDTLGDDRYIPPEDCVSYAPEVLTLYHLDTFDTPLF